MIKIRKNILSFTSMFTYTDVFVLAILCINVNSVSNWSTNQILIFGGYVKVARIRVFSCYYLGQY